MVLVVLLFLLVLVVAVIVGYLESVPLHPVNRSIYPFCVHMGCLDQHHHQHHYYHHHLLRYITSVARYCKGRQIKSTIESIVDSIIRNGYTHPNIVLIDTEIVQLAQGHDESNGFLQGDVAWHGAPKNTPTVY